ncbi:aldehyde dehydrogenase family protein [Desulfosporosinus fructosivorans]|uniref:Aldehyde dehydrogenase family protein n=1 Tax=Desulfosporosinus fructosivorans TaxID=2018669 RepID=A0A4Z0R8N1_9FIRM|nr:aldehyde dehydrogenase family protein [Desulfosporosinus fructosivorans]TGE39180.1 aldehyde dehydrogenase family protein [Desulfosporosinus fructosivorans]
MSTEPVVETKLIVQKLITKGRAAMEEIKDYSQEQANRLVQAVAWAIYQKEHAEELASISIRDTGLGKYEDKVIKNRRKTFGTLRDLMDQEAKSVGIIRIDQAKGITEIAKPVGIVAAAVPSTNPGATPANVAMMALKGRNAVIIAPSPKGASTTDKLLEYIHAELTKIGAPVDLVQALPTPVSKESTGELMKQADLVTVTGSGNNVKLGQSCGTPNVCVSAGNVVSIVDSSADLQEAAHKIMLSKTFDNATSCSSDNAIVIEAAVYEAMIMALKKEGGYFCNAEEKVQMYKAMWDENGKRRGITTAKLAGEMVEAAGLTNQEAENATFFMVEETGVGKAFPFSGEKLSLVLAVYKVENFDQALAMTKRILNYVGRGHSCGLHTNDESHIERIGYEMEVCRLLINQAQCFGNGGSFNNGLNFTLSMGGGTWAGNNIKENLSYKHFINITKVSRLIPEVIPTEEELFESYWAKYGR